ncbi:MAG: class I SAM-dependent methyltransferase [Sphingobacteriales bacterium]|jgi:SAM-dependent methyltransferase|nr:class I SAM-dependent methyltransferase [Sphingobacteriales bacterium]MBP9142764.1 class I SAM-dependent methyltransferase [Chitinophagales bacterium]MDA0198519.1 class I SAM-dependent methyltransferase [Bacteroidota bacterium]MBK6889592.1 class I SAM-dependent methyltransferase [Sphingobacteriales bacterium]MBK7527899.1 class I SAM-dependent methyltransferase [Sphingobacteriales bacterium]
MAQNDRSLNFESIYIAARRAEGRIFTDDLVAQLPNLPPNHKLANEWKTRKATLKILEKCLPPSNSLPLTSKLLDIGCGNGWFTNWLANRYPDAQTYGLEINQTELEQAKRVFKHSSIFWDSTDIFDSNHWQPNSFDFIFLNSVAQYFSNFEAVCLHLRQLLTNKSDARIFITDTPFYPSDQVEAARQRSKTYYTNLGYPEMADYYFHRQLPLDLKGHPHQFLYRPTFINNMWNKIFGGVMPVFPVIAIKK